MEPAPSLRRPAGRLVNVAATATPTWAFVPDPLPSAASLKVDPDVCAGLAAAVTALSGLGELAQRRPGPGDLAQLLLRRETLASVRMEGNAVPAAVLYAYEAGLSLPVTPATSADIATALAYERALRFGLSRIATLPFGLRLLSEVHQELMEGVRGARAIPGVFRGRDGGGPSTVPSGFGKLRAPPPAEAADALAALEQDAQANEDTPSLLRTALLHYQLLAVHPFLDRTEATVRLLTSVLLAASGVPPGLGAVLLDRRAAYDEALWGVCERGDWKGWVCFFLECVTDAAADAAARLERLNALRAAWRAQLGHNRSSRQLLELADCLFVSPLLTFPLAEQALGTNYRVARFAVQRLAAEGILSAATGDAFRKVFVARDVLGVLEEGL